MFSLWERWPSGAVETVGDAASSREPA